MDIRPLSVCKYCFVEMRAISMDKIHNQNRKSICTKCHNPWDTVIVIYDQKRGVYIQVHSMSQNSILAICPRVRLCKKLNCNYAHDQLELDFWNNQKMFNERPPMLNAPTYPHPPPQRPLGPIFTPPNNVYPTVQDIHPPPHPLNAYQIQHDPYVNQPPYSRPTLPTQPYPPQRMQAPYPMYPTQGPFYPPPQPHATSPRHNMRHGFRPSNPPRPSFNSRPTTDTYQRKTEPDIYYERVISSLDSIPPESDNDSFYVHHQFSRQPLEVKIELSQSPEILEWSFRVGSYIDGVEVVMGVVLHTNYGNNFRICSAKYKDGQMDTFEPISTIPERRGTVLLLKKLISKHCTLSIPVQFKVALGDFKAGLIFDFSHHKIVKTLHVLVQRKPNDPGPSREIHDKYDKYIKQPKKDSLLWDKDYEVKYFEHPYLKSDYEEIFTSKIPVNIEVMLKEEKYKSILDEELTKKNYKRIFEMLLYLEEYECRNIFLAYDLKDHPINNTVVVRQLEKYDKGRGGVEYAPKGLGFIKLEMSASLFEGFHFLRPPNIALLKPKAERNFVYHCPMVEQGHDYMWIAVSDELIKECERYGGTADIRFKENSIDFHFSMLHQALQNLDPRIIFPLSRTKTSPFKIRIRETFWEKSNLTVTQREAINAALDNSYQNLPTVISGPFGCGKTWTLANLAYLLGSQSDRSRILVCCKNNAPANKYIYDIHQLSEQHGYNFDISNGVGIKLLYRLFTPIYRVQGSYSDIAKRYATLNQDDYGIIPKDENYLTSCRIIVTTVFTCPFLLRMDLPKDFFTHIILDEAAQISEPELGIPLSLAGPCTKLIIAGDEYQVTPKLTSPISQKFGLELSLLERLSSETTYKTPPFTDSLIYLKENYRSDPAIVHLLSKLYYSRSLVGMRPQQEVAHNDVKPLIFHGVIGREERIRDSPSYMNSMEADEVVHIVQEMSNIFSLKDFGVLSTYIGQIWLVRDKLRKAGLGSVEVVNFEGIQGKEYRVLIVCTVRTLSDKEYAVADPLSMGLLEEPKQLNTVLGRAKDHVIVVGNPYTLCEIGKNKKAWQTYIAECINLGSFYVGGEQTFQFRSIPNDITITNRNKTVSNSGHTDANGLPDADPDSMKERAKFLIGERERCLQELINLCQEVSETQLDLQKHIEREQELILKMNQKDDIEKNGPSNEQNGNGDLDMMW